MSLEDMRSPEDTRLSAYLDDELSVSESQRLGDRLQQDAELQDRYARLRGVQEFLRSEGDPSFQEAMERTWHRLSLRNFEQQRPNWWSRPVAVPFSAVAAAFAILVLVGGLLIRFGGPTYFSAEPQQADRFGDTVELSAHARESEELLRRLSGWESRDEVTIQLPESRTFEFVGQPVIAPAGH